MAIYLPASAEEQDIALDELTPREIVAELDKHVVGQRPPSAPWPSLCAIASDARNYRPTSPTTSCPRTSS